MTAERPEPLTITIGEPYRHEITFTDGDGEPLDCSGWSDIASQVRASSAAADPLCTFALHEDTDLAAGVLVLVLSAEDTADLAPISTAVTDVERSVGGGEPETVFGSRVCLVRDVTR